MLTRFPITDPHVRSFDVGEKEIRRRINTDSGMRKNDTIKIIHCNHT